jgi:putative nucleotidyltransferase with HDIG domain
MTATFVATHSQFAVMPLAAVIPDAVPPVDLYLRERSGRMTFYRSAHIPVEAGELDQLRERGVTEFHVKVEDQAQVSGYLETQLSTLLSNESHPVGDRMRVLNHVVRDTLQHTFTKSTDAAVSASQGLSHHMVEFSRELDVKMGDIARMARHDYCTFTHSANVASYAVLLARKLGINDEQELQQLNTAALLHDLGKLEIPEKILQKPGRLTDQEMSVIRQHPTRGFQVLRREQSLTKSQLLMVYQHHERIDGSGYPVGCTGNEIHAWGRLCAVVDVFEALTGKRPYRTAATPEEAIAIMERTSGTHFDKDMLRCWASSLLPR